MITPPAPLSLLLRTVPDAVHAEMLARLFSHLLKGQWIADQLTDLEGKRVCIGIRDTGNELLFAIHDRRLRRLPRGQGSQQPWDVRIAGNLGDFWLLATRSEDPDTLFFERRLTIEGETETGLYIKNLLDALDFDWDAHLEAVVGPRIARTARRLAQGTGIERRVKQVLGRIQRPQH